MIAAVMRAASKLLAMGAGIVDGTPPPPIAIASLLFDSACELGCEDELRSFLTPEAVARVQAEREAALRAKTGG